MVEQAPVVVAATVRAHHESLGGAEGAHLRVGELGTPVYSATALAQATAHHAKAFAAPARLDSTNERTSHGRKERKDRAKQEH
jgi:hypothetical protein